MIRIRNVSKTYDRLRAVRSMSLDVEKGAMVGFVGPNGAGKTTLFKMIATLVKPDTGSIHVDGKDVRFFSAPTRKMLGFMPAEFGKVPHMTVSEYLSYFGAAHGISARRRAQRIEDVLMLTDLGERAEMPVGAGSTGIKQRILIAKTLIHDPEILLLDEPAAGLDPRARIEIREILKELNKIGKTILLSSHILADLEEICDSIVIIEHGQRILSGNLNELKDRIRDESFKSIEMETTADAIEKALATLKASAAVSHLECQRRKISFRTSLASANPILMILIQNNIEIKCWNEEEPDLEDVFMKQTKGVIG
jgi:ABC-2 type transport system ATP-binding protein